MLFRILKKDLKRKKVIKEITTFLTTTNKVPLLFYL